MPLGFVEIDYYIATAEGRRPAHGVQIGRFAVRNDIDDDVSRIQLPPKELAPWIVDHVPTGLATLAFSTFEEAYAFADDLSRFSKSDPASKDGSRAVKQIGPNVGRWAESLRASWTEHEEAPKYTPYREWLATQGKEWRPRKRRPKSLFG